MRLAVVLSLAVLVLTGCKTDFDRMRREHAEAYPTELAAKTAEAMRPDAPLTLDDCVRIALERNLQARSAEISQRLATLDRKVAFSNFLPVVEYQWQRSGTDRPGMRRAGGAYMQTSDKYVTTNTIAVQQQIFLPQTWFLYFARQKGEDISQLLLERTRQQITLQVAALYYANLSLVRTRPALEASVAEAEALLTELRALEAEDLVTATQRQDVETLVLARRASLDEHGREEQRLRASLLETMGLSPFAHMELAECAPFVAVRQPAIEEQVLRALMQRPEMRVADRAISIRKDQVKIALAEFLPKLVGFGGFTHTSDSFVKSAEIWSVGAQGVMTVFNGFQNIYEYRAAREREQDAFIQRERSCLMIMDEVLRARLHVQRATDQLNVARSALAAADSNMREVDARWKEGFVQTSDRLQALTRRDESRGAAHVAEFQYQVAVATLYDVLGETRIMP